MQIPRALATLPLVSLFFGMCSCANRAASTPPTATASPFRFVDGDGYRELHYQGRPIYRYMIKYDPKDRENTYKPFHHVYGFHDEGFITKGPGGMETHHRGIFFGL